jgi:transposase
MSRQILYYRLEKGISADQTALALKVMDSTLEARLYPGSRAVAQASAGELPGKEYIEQELARKHMTLQCLYDEYRLSTAEPVSRASFYRHYQRQQRIAPSMAMEHRGGSPDSP